MENTIKTIPYRGHTIKLIQDEDAQNPRHEMDNAGNVAIWSRDYRLSDKNLLRDPDDYSPDEWAVSMLAYYAEPKTGTTWEWTDKLEAMKSDDLWALFGQHFIWLPLMLGYRAEGITAYPETDVWAEECKANWTGRREPDGLIFISKADAVKEFGGKICTKAVRDKALKCLEAEIEIYGQYLSGEVFGFVAEDADEEHIDSCWGFYPDEREGFGKRYDYAIEQAKYAIDSHIDSAGERDQSGEHEFALESDLVEA